MDADVVYSPGPYRTLEIVHVQLGSPAGGNSIEALLVPSVVDSEPHCVQKPAVPPPPVPIQKSPPSPPAINLALEPEAALSNSSVHAAPESFERSMDTPEDGSVLMLQADITDMMPCLFTPLTQDDSFALLLADTAVFDAHDPALDPCVAVLDTEHTTLDP